MKNVVSKITWWITPLIVIVLALYGIAQSASAQFKEVRPIRCAASSNTGLSEVWNRYVEGLRHGDAARLSSIFADEGTFHILSKPAGSDTETISARPFSEIIPQWVTNPDKKASGRILTMAVDHNMATIRGTLDFDLDRFDDILTLYCVNSSWLIVGKLTYGRERQPH
jgi:hypothetical protein